MQDKISFSREKISNLDVKPYDDMYVDEIYDHGFFNGCEPRVGIIKHNINSNLNYIKNLEQIIKESIKNNYKIDAKIKVKL